MNVERMLQLADVVERSETYDQSRYWHLCNTPACVAGHCIALAGLTDDDFSADDDCEWYYAMEWLGLTIKQANDLFGFDPTWSKHPLNPTRSEAAAEIRRMVREYQGGA